MNKINPTQNNNLNFKARNQIIKDADKICRTINKELPTFSQTRIEVFTPKAIHRPNNYNILKYYVAALRYVRAYSLKYKENIKIFAILKAVKESKIANCGEMADITYTALKMNGIDSARKYSLYSINKKTGEIKDLDHSIVGFNYNLPKNYKFSELNAYAKKEDLITPDKKMVIIDSWGGFADYAPNALVKYKYNLPIQRIFDKDKNPIMLNKDEIIKLLPAKDIDFKENDIKYLKHAYPELILNKNSFKEENTQYPEYNLPEFQIGTLLNIKINCGLKSGKQLLPTPKESTIKKFFAPIINFFTIK